jgi:hypothetical protein
MTYFEAEIMTAFVAAIVTATISLYPAKLLNSVFEEKNPQKLSFLWGYFAVIFNYLIWLLGIFYGLIISLSNQTSLFVSAIMVVGLMLLSFVSLRALQRTLWALIVIINILYLRNRWSEFRFADALSAEETKVNEKPKKKPINGLIAGDLIKNYKGFGIVKQEQGVSVGSETFSNVIEAEKHIAENIDNLRPYTGAFEGNDSVSNEFNSNELDEDRQGLLSEKKEDYNFVTEALRMYKDGGLSEAAVLEIVLSKRK